jgi:hypothetical protein
LSDVDSPLTSPAPEVLAALVWDEPALRRSKVPGARAFAEAFDAPPAAPQEEHDDSLSRAARGVLLYRAGDGALAAEHFKMLLSAGEWERLLGLMLLAWASTERRAVHAARATVSRIDDELLRARLINKLSLFAFDHGWDDLGRSLCGDALEYSPEGTRLREVLLQRAFDVGLSDSWPLPREGGRREQDPLISLPWVREEAHAGAHEALVLGAEDRLEGTWSWTIRTGRTPLDRMIAADVQATWAGAFWLRGWMRRAMGAHMLAGAANTPERWAWGAVMWLVGGGRKTSRVVAHVEPHLDEHGADFIVRALEDEAFTRNGEERYREAINAAWDLISDGLAKRVLTRMAVDIPAAPELAQTQKIWAALLLRGTTGWAERYEALSDEQRRSLVPELSPAGVRTLPENLQRDILRLCVELIRSERKDAWVSYLAASLAIELDDKAALSVVFGADPPARALHYVAGEHPGLVPDALLAAKEQNLIEAVERQNEEALTQASLSFGAESPRVLLGQVAADRQVGRPPGISVLISTVMDARLPGEWRTEAHQGLAVAHNAAKLTDDDLAALREAPDDPGEFAFHGDVTPALLHAFRLGALAPALSPDDCAALISLVRDPEDRVRQVAVGVSGRTLATVPDEGLAWGLVSGLFDPNSDVVDRGLQAVGVGALDAVPSAKRAALERIPRLYESAGRTTRVEVVRAARRLLASGVDNRGLGQLVTRALEDRSWRVRRVATEDDEI